MGTGIALLFNDRGTRRGWVVSSTPRPHFTPGKDLVPILQEGGWPQGRSGRSENLVPIGIRSQTVQPIVSRYTDWSTRPTNRTRKVRKSKVKCTLVQTLRLCTDHTAHRGNRSIAVSFLDHGTRRGEGSASLPGCFLPPGKTRYPLYRRLGGPQGWFEQVRKISPPLGFDLRSAQPVASRYTDWATRPTL